jgi:hypothetical protein
MRGRFMRALDLTLATMATYTGLDIGHNGQKGETMQTDCAWRTRVTTFYAGAEAAAIIARASNETPKINKASEIEAEYVARPFRFEDLNGRPEPAKWGPTYPKTASAAVEKWRMTARGRELSAEEKRAYGQAVGEWIRNLNAIKPAPRVSLKYKMPDYAAMARAAFAAAANADRREWADGKRKSNCVGLLGLTIEQAYAQAMAEKAARLAGETVREPKRLNTQPTLKPSKRIARKTKAAKQREAA